MKTIVPHKTDRNDFLRTYWAAVAAQDAAAMRDFFTSDAVIQWHNTNERFTLAEFIRANCEYPGAWRGSVERLDCTDSIGEHFVTATRVWAQDDSVSFHVVSFFGFQNGKIATLDEYWGDDAPAPQWRQNLHLGTEICR